MDDTHTVCPGTQTKVHPAFPYDRTGGGGRRVAFAAPAGRVRHARCVAHGGGPVPGTLIARGEPHTGSSVDLFVVGEAQGQVLVVGAQQGLDLLEGVA